MIAVLPFRFPSPIRPQTGEGAGFFPPVLPLGELGDGGSDLEQLPLKLRRLFEVGFGQAAAQLPFAEAQEQLFRGRLVDRLGRRDGVELRKSGHGLLVGPAVEDHCTKSPVKLAVEVVLRNLAQRVVEHREGDAGGEDVPLEPVTGFENAPDISGGRVVETRA